ncbi:MAG: hypothetical protein AB1782_08305 [Cyanobacteriota bacterium]
MFRRLVIINSFLVLALLIFLTSCNQPAQQQDTSQQPQQENFGPAPDYKEIENVLQDPSPIVKLQGLKRLKTMRHPDSINIFIKVLKDNVDEKEVRNYAIKGIVDYKDLAVAPIKEQLWDQNNIKYQAVAFKVLSEVIPKEEFFSEVTDRYYNTPYSDAAAGFRRLLVRYITENADPEDPNALADVVGMLRDSDRSVISTASSTLGAWKTDKVVELVTESYKQHPEDERLTMAILQAFSNYEKPSQDNPAPIKDITVFLQSFGSYNEEIQKEAFSGLWHYGYEDPEGKILNHINSFANCNDELVRSHVVNLQGKLPQNVYPENQAPIFELPNATQREGFCK